MIVHTLKQTQVLPLSREEAWNFFSSPRNLDEITPDDLGFKITYLPSETMYEGEIITYKVKIMPGLWVPWVTEISNVTPLESFIDQQLSGPYKLWHHLHTFEDHEQGVLMTDLVHYSIGWSLFGEIPHRLFVREKLERIFQFRKENPRREIPARSERMSPKTPFAASPLSQSPLQWRAAHCGYGSLFLACCSTQ